MSHPFDVLGDSLDYSPVDTYQKSINAIYDTSKPGHLAIFNFINVKGEKIRKGTHQDVENLRECFSKFNFEIMKPFTDLNYNQVCQELKNLANYDYSEKSALIVVFMTHGGVNGQLKTADGNSITSHTIWEYFSPEKCPSLKFKPKIYIFQACKGGGRSEFSIPIVTDGCNMQENKHDLPNEANFLIAYSTQEGKVAYRHEEEGSWFIQSLCKQILSFYKKEDFVSILTIINNDLAVNYGYVNPYQELIYKQMPIFLSTLTKKYYLSAVNETANNDTRYDTSPQIDGIEQNENGVSGSEKTEQKNQ